MLQQLKAQMQVEMDIELTHNKTLVRCKEHCPPDGLQRSLPEKLTILQELLCKRLQ